MHKVVQLHEYTYICEVYKSVSECGESPNRAKSTILRHAVMNKVPQGFRKGADLVHQL